MHLARKGVALITGATSGIGEAFAEAFAARGHDLIITGRRKDEIEAVARRIRSGKGVGVEVIRGDLADGVFLEYLVQTVRKTNGLEVLVNNAGFGVGGGFTDQSESAHETMLAVHAGALMRLTHAALPVMIAAGTGAVINVSSLGAFLPFPGNAMYGGTKAFVSQFSESLHLELRGTGVRVQALCPGMTRTDFHSRMGLDPKDFYQTRGVMKAMTPRAVVEASLACLEKDRPICIPGANNRFIYLMCRLAPRRLLYRIVTSASEGAAARGR
jgi:short-subunit dehydrogenase